MILQGVFLSRWVFSSKVNGRQFNRDFYHPWHLKSQFLSHTSHTNFYRFYRIQWKVTKWPHEPWGNGLVNIPYLHGAYGNGIRFHQIGWYPGNSRVFPFQKSYMLSAQTSCFRSLSISARTAQRAPLFCYADFCRRNWPKPELRMEVPKNLQSCWWEIPSCKRENLTLTQ